MGGCCSQPNSSNNLTQEDAAANVSYNYNNSFENHGTSTSTTEFGGIISNDSWIHCFRYLSPFDFFLIRRTCVKFNSITNPSNGLINEYWRNQCTAICIDAMSAIENGFTSREWDTIYYQIIQTVTRRNYFKDSEPPSLLDGGIFAIPPQFRSLYQTNEQFVAKFPITLLKDFDDEISLERIQYVVAYDYYLLFSMILHTKIVNKNVNIDTDFLSDAIVNNAMSILEYLLSFDTLKFNNCDVLKHAIRENNPKIVKMVVTHPNFHIRSMSNFKLWSIHAYEGKQGFILHYAIKCGYTNVAKILLKNGMGNDQFINMKDPYDGYTPLHAAVMNNDDEISEILLGQYSNIIKVNVTDVQCVTPLMRACKHYNGNMKVIQRLLEFDDCDVLYVDPHGWNCLMYAASEDKVDVVKYVYDFLIEKYGQSEVIDDFVNQRTTYVRNETAYLIAKRKGFDQTMKILATHCKCNVEIE